MNEHEVSLKNDLKYLLNNENYWNVMMFCKDGTMAHNRLTAGLIFPQLQDEISVICPDYTMQDITDQINKFLYFGEVVENKRDKICASHVLDSDVRNFVQDLGFAENDYQGKMFANNELPNQEINLDVSFDLDIPLEDTNKDLSPLDQLCLDLAPFNQKPKEREKNKKLKPILTKNTNQLLASNVPKVNSEITKTNDPFSSTKWITDKNLELENTFDDAMRNLHDEVAQLTETCMDEDTFRIETSEDIVEGVIELILDNINYDSYQNFQSQKRVPPLRTDSIDSNASTSSVPQPSNLIFSTLGSFRQAEPDEPIIRLTAYESQLGFDASQFSPLKTPLSPLFEDYTPNIDHSCEYIEEKPDISRFVLEPVISDKNDINCRIDIEKMALGAEDWKVIHMYLEEADDYDIKARNKNQIKKENSTGIIEKPMRFMEKNKGPFKAKRGPFKRPKRLNRCFKCENCMMSDCRKCLHCKDMKKYGGRGTKKQSCMERRKCIQYSKFDYVNKKRHPQPIPSQKRKEDISNTITLEKYIDDDDSEDYVPQTSVIKNKKKRKLERDHEQEEIEEKKKKVKEIKERFKKQEAALKEGRNPLLSVLSRDELLFGFHL